MGKPISLLWCSEIVQTLDGRLARRKAGGGSRFELPPREFKASGFGELQLGDSKPTTGFLLERARFGYAKKT